MVSPGGKAPLRGTEAVPRSWEAVPRSPYDAALAGLDLAAVHLRQEHTREVMFLAGRMQAVFRTFNIEREALAALSVFCEAARREEATVALARRTAEIIEKVQREAPPKGGRGGKA